MENVKQLETKFKNNMEKSINNFNSVYPNYEDKINFLKELNEKDDFLNGHHSKELLEESMRLLVENAMVTETRKMQQQYIMPILSKMFQKVPANEIANDFKNESNSFTIFCITALSFKYESHMKEHGETHHKNIIEALDKYTLELSKL